jgi:hypothetical protein
MMLKLRPMYHITFPTAASPSKTSFTLLLGFGAAGVVSAILCPTFKCLAQEQFVNGDDEGSQKEGWVRFHYSGSMRLSMQAF